MIVKKTWYKHKHHTRYDYMGIFLLGETLEIPVDEEDL